MLKPGCFLFRKSKFAAGKDIKKEKAPASEGKGPVFQRRRNEKSAAGAGRAGACAATAPADGIG